MSSASREPFERELRGLGGELNERSDEVVAGMMRRSRESGVVLEPVVEDNFAKVGAVSTVALARWMAGEGEEAAREEGMESWRIFGQLAAQRAVPLNEVTKRCLRWRDAAKDVLCKTIARRRLPEELLERAQEMLQRRRSPHAWKERCARLTRLAAWAATSSSSWRKGRRSPPVRS